MPFTVSHAAAALPLHRWMGRSAVLSALVIGCWVPDLPYFLPLPITRGVTHSTLGLVYFCLPMGLAAYLIYHALLKQPLALLLPPQISARLGALVFSASRFPAVPAYRIVLSLLAGAISHLAWDAFTHGDAPGVRALLVLQQPLFAVGEHVLYRYAALQHASTLLGLLVLWRSSVAWLAQAPLQPLPIAWSSAQRRTAILTLCTLAACCMAVLSVRLLTLNPPVQGFRMMTGALVIATLQSSGIAILAYGCGWQLHQRQRRSNTNHADRS